MNPIICCRSAPPKETLLPDARLGYECSVCEEPLQLTSAGRGVLAANPGARLFCNPCGLIFVHLAEAQGDLVVNQMSPTAKAQLDQGNDSLMANWVRKHTA